MTDTTQDIRDEGFHEIQLSGKQLVFLFMATTVVSVVIFLCGVLVGRNVQTAQPLEAAAASTTPAPSAAATTPPTPVAEEASAQAAPGPAEPPSPPAEDELTYRKRLESEGSPSESLKPQAAAPGVEAKAEAARTEPARAASAPADKAVAPKTGSDPAGATGRPGRWVVQLVALRDRGAASSIVQRLAGKGYPAFIVSPSASTPNQVFKVQVGRYDDRAEAEQVSRRLEKEEKFRPWISR